jgi:pimeloyl-ACP methyl ester carboxylesterase
MAAGPRRRSRWRRVLTWFAAFAILVVGLAATVLWFGSSPPTPDAFYDAPAALPEAPGTLLRHERLTQGAPQDAVAWRILYTTTRDEGIAAVASAVVVAPASRPDGPRPVIAWTHGTTGVARGCAPTLLLEHFPLDLIPGLGDALSRGWVIVGTDYAGLGTEAPHPYLIGQGEGRSALDAVRAARQVPDLTLADRTVVWGHSQGGHAALWTGILAPRYAPDVGVVGVAALAPATDLPTLIEAAKETVVGRIMSAYVASAYSAAYPDVRFEDYVAPVRRARAMASRCLAGRGALASIGMSIALERPFFQRSPSAGPLGLRLRQNVPDAAIDAPLLVAQGLADDLVLPDVQDRFMRGRCSAGQQLHYRSYAGRDHIGLVTPDSALPTDLVGWTAARFAGEPVGAGCRFDAR